MNLLWINVVMGVLVLVASISQAFGNSLHFYEGTLLTMLHAAAATGLALAGIVRRRLAFQFLLISSIALATLPFSCIASVGGYAGGDDGGSFGWAVFVGGASLLSLAVAGSTAAIGILRRNRWHKKMRGLGRRERGYRLDGKNGPF